MLPLDSMRKAVPIALFALALSAMRPAPLVAWAFKALPHDYKEAVEKRGLDFVLKNGTVPWRAEEIYIELRNAFKALETQGFARDNVKLFSSVLSHYVADAHVPFHAVINYDGQLTGQWGIHSRFETELFVRYKDKLAISPKS